MPIIEDQTIAQLFDWLEKQDINILVRIQGKITRIISNKLAEKENFDQKIPLLNKDGSIIK